MNRRPPRPDARDAWNRGADAYAAFIESGEDGYRLLLHGPALLAACAPLEGVEVLDVGCGQGYFSRELAQAGARVTGIDLSDRLLARAQEIEAARPRGIRYEALDAARIGTAFPAGRFDLATACMSLQDIEDLGATLAGVVRVLRPTGRLVFSVPHPCIDLPVREWARDREGRKTALQLDRYFDAGPALFHWNMPRLDYSWHTPCRRRTLGEWSTLLLEAGLRIRRLIEPRPTLELRAAHPEFDDAARMPFFLIFDVEVAR